MATVRAKLAWDTLLDVDGAGPGPLHDRLTRALRQAIRDGRLAAGSALPPSRALALDLGCSRWVVTQAYAQLVAEGYLSARTGAATIVREIAPGPGTIPSATGEPTAQTTRSNRPNRPGQPSHAGRSSRSRRSTEPSQARRSVHPDQRQPPPTGSTAIPAPRFDLAPGLPDLREFPRRRWTESVRTQLSAMPYTDLGYPPPGGVLRLREVMADYLRRVRGAVAGSDDLTCCLSVSEGVARLAARLIAAGITTIAVEDPGWTRLRQTLERVGMETVGVGVDDKGLRTSELAAQHDVRAVLVTPAHQFPTGVVLAPERRAALLAWARDVDGLVLEDDYDAEFRYDRRPVGTLQGTDPRHVALFGSLSKTLSPALGLGWMVTPPRWTDALREHESGMVMPPALNQLAFAEFVESGGYDRHLRAARQRYRHRRDALVAALAAKLPGCVLTGVAAGLHLVLQLEPSTPAAAVLDSAAAEGVKVADLDTYRLRPDPSAPALVLGYGNLPDGAVVPAVSRLAAAVAAVRTDVGADGVRTARPRGAG